MSHFNFDVKTAISLKLYYDCDIDLTLVNKSEACKNDTIILLLEYGVENTFQIDRLVLLNFLRKQY